MTYIDYAIDTYRDNQLSDYLERTESVEDDQPILCDGCDEEAYLKETFKGKKTDDEYEICICLKCRKHAIKEDSGIRGYYQWNRLVKIEVIK